MKDYRLYVYLSGLLFCVSVFSCMGCSEEKEVEVAETTPMNKLQIVDRQTGADLLYHTDKMYVDVFRKDTEGEIICITDEESGSISRNSTEQIALISLFAPVIHCYTNRSDSVFYISLDGGKMDTLVFDFENERYTANGDLLKKSGQYERYFVWEK